MSCVQRLKEEHLTCSICHEVFKQPITLSCFHHFCQECLISFTRTKPDIIVQGCFPCATCRQLTPIPDPQRPLEEWAEQLHSGFFVQGLIDALGDTADQDKCKPEVEHCSPCQEEGDINPATKWCTDCEIALCARCFRLHQRFENTHIFCDVTDQMTRNKPKLKCSIHPDKRVHLFCHDCGDAVCSTCSTTVHRQCKTVTSLSEAVPYMKNVLGIKFQKGESINKARRNQISRLKVQSEKLITSLKKAKEDSENITQKLMSVIFTKQELLQKQLEQMENDDLAEMIKVIKHNTDLADKHTAELNDITTALHSGSDMDLCMEYMKDRAADDEAGDEAARRNVVTHVTLTTEIRSVIEDIEKHGLGHIVTTTGSIGGGQELSGAAKPQSTPTKTPTISKVFTPDPSELPVLTEERDAVAEKTPKKPNIKERSEQAKTCLKHTLDTKLPDDKREPDINDIVAVKVKGVEVIVVTDHSNISIKSFYKQGRKQRHSWLRLEDTPDNMTILTGNTLAVTVPLLQQIVIVNIGPDLWYQSTVATKKVYNGLVSVNPSTLMAGTNNGVDVIDMSGQILKSITKHPDGSRLFTSPYYMCKSPAGLIVVTDTGSKRIIFMTEKGEVTAIHSPSGNRRLQCPCGVSASSQAVFFADSGARKVIQLSLEGKYMKDVLTSRDGLQCPDGIFAVDEKKLCVGDKRYVKTFQLT